MVIKTNLTFLEALLTAMIALAYDKQLTIHAVIAESLHCHQIVSASVAEKIVMLTRNQRNDGNNIAYRYNLHTNF